MLMKEQILQFRQLLDKHGLSVDDFELNVDGEMFRLIMAGEPADLEVLCRSSQRTKTYRCDGSPQWLELFSKDLAAELFSTPS
jgi:hypothetical protein